MHSPYQIRVYELTVSCYSALPVEKDRSRSYIIKYKAMDAKAILIIPVQNQERQLNRNLALLKDLNCDLLIVDDGSTDQTYSIVKKNPWIKYIKHEFELGIGASIITGYEYSRDYSYDIMILLDLNNTRFREEIAQLVENLNYGYDIVSSSRILENFDHKDIPANLLDITTDLASGIRNITSLDITDPLSGIKAIRITALKDMELTEFNHGIFLQMLIQANYLGLSIIEIPAISGNGFGNELSEYEDPVGLFLSLMETEKFLYPKKSMN